MCLASGPAVQSIKVSAWLTEGWLGLQHQGNSSIQECAQAGVHVRPRKGDALLFYSLQPNGELVRHGSPAQALRFVCAYDLDGPC